jgi:hypothetical protein
MSMSHKAFIFDFDAFEVELRGLLEQALSTGDVRGLRAFIERRKGEAKDPCEGAPLGSDWEERLHVRDVDEYGDHALTVYYDPADDFGLAEDWMELDGLLAESEDSELLLGAAIAAGNKRFDPGKMGSYLQSRADVHRHRRRAEELARERPELEPVRYLLELAAAGGKGLYVTF